MAYWVFVWDIIVGLWKSMVVDINECCWSSFGLSDLFWIIQPYYYVYDKCNRKILLNLINHVMSHAYKKCSTCHHLCAHKSSAKNQTVLINLVMQQHETHIYKFVQMHQS